MAVVRSVLFSSFISPAIMSPRRISRLSSVLAGVFLRFSFIIWVGLIDMVISFSVDIGDDNTVVFVG